MPRNRVKPLRKQTIVPDGVNMLVNSVNIHRRAFEDLSSAGIVRNEFGFIRSDFADLMKNQTSYQMQMLAQRLASQTFATKEEKKNMSFDELVKRLKPRLLQSPKELDDFEQYLLSLDLSEYERIRQDNELKKREEEKEFDSFTRAVADRIAPPAEKPANA